MLIEIHMLKNFPATNLNRDDTGAPKNCIFGGVQRGRISSQCLKRSWRTSPLFQKEMEGHLGTRTRKMPQMVVNHLKENGVAEEYLPVVQKKLTGFANKTGKETDTGETSQIVIYSPEDISAIADVIQSEIENCGNVKEFEKKKATDIEKLVKGAETRPISLDIALFGRMVTSTAFANVEASMQVAHAFSTNKILMETDFFTAMDDLIDGNEDLGSAMMGEVDYNSACYYIYASLDVDKLETNLCHSTDVNEIVHTAIPSLLRTMAYTNPSGKQNTFAGHSLPSAVLVECKEMPIPVSYANAFVKPARADHNHDLVVNSIKSLIDQVHNTAACFPSLSIAKRIWFCAVKDEELKIDESVNCPNFDVLVQEVENAIGK